MQRLIHTARDLNRGWYSEQDWQIENNGPCHGSNPGLRSVRTFLHDILESIDPIPGLGPVQGDSTITPFQLPGRFRETIHGILNSQ